MSARAIRMDTILQPIAISILAFAIGYQARAHIAPSFATAAGGAATRQPESTKRPKSDVVDLTDGPKADASTSTKPQTKSKKGKAASSSSSGQSEGESDAEVDTDSEAEDLALALSSNPQSLKPTAFDEVKLVLVVNDSLHMTKGKIAAQAGHATLSCALMMKDVNPRMYKHWERHGQPKIALKCKDTEELEILAAQARSLNLCARTIQDAGRTQVAPGSKTILGIGPGPARLINQVTGKLKLL